jgi:hypothetical protein
MRGVIIPSKIRKNIQNLRKKINNCFFETEDICYHINKSLEKCQGIKCEYYKSINPINEEI